MAECGGGGCKCGQAEGYGELLKYTLPGFLLSLVAGLLLDAVGLQRSGWGQAVVRTIAGEGESLLEGIYALRRRLSGAVGSMAEAYGWGKLAGLAVPWVVDGASRAAGLDVYAAYAFYIPWLYAMSDQAGANIAGLLFLRRRHGAWDKALAAYGRDPVMLASLGVLAAAPVGLLAARLGGFSPETQLLTAIETVVANLCWLPPVIGWWADRRRTALS